MNTPHSVFGSMLLRWFRPHPLASMFCTSARFLSLYSFSSRHPKPISCGFEVFACVLIFTPGTEAHQWLLLIKWVFLPGQGTYSKLENGRAFISIHFLPSLCTIWISAHAEPWCGHRTGSQVSSSSHAGSWFRCFLLRQQELCLVVVYPKRKRGFYIQFVLRAWYTSRDKYEHSCWRKSVAFLLFSASLQAELRKQPLG